MKIEFAPWIACTLLFGSIFGACSDTPPSAVAPPNEALSTISPSEELEWIPLDPPAGPGALAARLQRSGESVLLTWLEPRGDGHILRFSRFTDTWSEPVDILEGDDFFANWADMPAIIEANDGTLYAHMLRKLGESTYAYGAFLAHSTDASSWHELGLLHDDDSATEHGFVSYIAQPQGAVRAFWLDGRAMLEEGGSMHLRTALLGAEGAQESELLDERVCECCSTDAVLTEEGPLVAYRDRDADEIRDISVVRGGAEGWGRPRTVHEDGWKIFGCPVNGPALAADGSRVAIAWFSAADDNPRVQIAFSEDSGDHFSTPILVDGDSPIGRVDIELDSQGAAHLSWLGTAGDGGEIRLRKITPDGHLGPVQNLAKTSQSRAAGVPRLARLGEDLLLVWVEEDHGPEELARLRAARIKLSQGR